MPPVLRKRKIVPIVKIFKFYSHLPSELRMTVVDEMKPDDRCRFRRCSKLSSKEATSSKKFIRSLEIYDVPSVFPFFQSMAIRVKYDDTVSNCGFHLKFEQLFGVCVIRYLTLDLLREFWRIQLNFGMENYAATYFKNLLKTYRNSIKELRVNTNMTSMCNFEEEIDKLNNLKRLEITTKIDLMKFLSKLRRPLEVLIYREREPTRSYENFQKICLISKRLDMIDLQLNYQQFLRLTAQSISINIGALTVEDISNFIKSWQYGTIRENFQSCRWFLHGSNFDFPQLLALLGVASNGGGFCYALESKIEQNQQAWLLFNRNLRAMMFLRLL